MNLAIAGQPLPFEISTDAGLSFVALKVFDVSLGFPGSLVATIPMTEYAPGSYGASFSGAVLGKSYVVSKAVYLSGAYTNRDPDYAPGSESFTVTAIGSIGTIVAQLQDLVNALIAALPSGIVATVETNDEIKTFANLDQEIQAIVSAVIELEC